LDDLAMSRPLTLSPDRLLPVDNNERGVARRLLAAVAGRAILSPHGHVEASLLADNEPLPDPAALLITPDHYVTRMLHADGVPLHRLGYVGPPGTEPPVTAREIWSTFCQRWHLFRGTPSRYWLEYELSEVFGITVQPAAETADLLFDQISERLQKPEYLPRALCSRFNLEVLATTDDPCSPLDHHRVIAADDTLATRVLPTFRPDPYLSPASEAWPAALARLSACTGDDTENYESFVNALQSRRDWFRAHGATSTDHGPIDVSCEPLEVGAAAELHRRCFSGDASLVEADAYRGHLLFEMARMSADDGLVMQLHPGVLRDHHEPTRALFGSNTGHDIPMRVEFTQALRPILTAFGTDPQFRAVLFTVDESTFSRELAPLAGFYPSVYVGAPWWFLDTPEAMIRFREAVTDTAGFYRTAGFVDDTRAFCSIPARHDLARRMDAGFLARLVCRHQLSEEEAAETMVDLVATIPRDVFRLGAAEAVDR
jgi:glucuronate isomerase